MTKRKCGLTSTGVSKFCFAQSCDRDMGLVYDQMNGSHDKRRSRAELALGESRSRPTLREFFSGTALAANRAYP